MNRRKFLTFLAALPFVRLSGQAKQKTAKPELDGCPVTRCLCGNSLTKMKRAVNISDPAKDTWYGNCVCGAKVFVTRSFSSVHAHFVKDGHIWEYAYTTDYLSPEQASAGVSAHFKEFS